MVAKGEEEIARSTGTRRVIAAEEAWRAIGQAGQAEAEARPHACGLGVPAPGGRRGRPPRETIALNE